MIKFRKNSGRREAGAVTSYKDEKKVVKTTAKKHDYSTYEVGLEKTMSQNEAVQEVINKI